MISILTHIKKVTFPIIILVAGCTAKDQVTGLKTKTLCDHEKSVNDLMENDRQLDFASDIQLSESEKRLNEKLVALRTQMKAHYDSLGFFPPSSSFYKYKEHIEQTDLYHLLKKMPKGGVLHLHSSGSIDFEWLINKAITLPECHVFWADSNDEHIKGHLNFFEPGKAPGGYVTAIQLQASEKNFKQELHDLLSIREETLKDSSDVWIDFERIFQRTNKFYAYKPIFKEHLRNLVDRLIADGLQHIELREIFGAGLYELTGDGSKVSHPIDTTIQIMLQVEKDIRQQHPEFSMKLIYTSYRFLPEEDVFDELVNAYHYRKQYPDFIKGFDLVAEEDNGHTTGYFLESWSRMDSLEELYGIDMPLYLHDGESNSPGIKNLYDAYALKSVRIGHGFNLMFFPTLVEKVKEADICIEVSPLSNQILGYVKDLRLHPAALMLRHGVQGCISPDDPGVFDYNGLSYDYWTIVMAWELDLRSIKKLILNSLTYSALSNLEKKKSIEAWEEKWNAFVTYGNDFLN